MEVAEKKICKQEESEVEEQKDGEEDGEEGGDEDGEEDMMVHREGRRSKPEVASSGRV